MTPPGSIECISGAAFCTTRWATSRKRRATTYVRWITRRNGRRIAFLLDIGAIFQRFNQLEATSFYFQKASQLLEDAQAGLDLQPVRAKLLRFQADLLLEQATRSSPPDSATLLQVVATARSGLSVSLAEGLPTHAAFCLTSLAKALSRLGEDRAALGHMQQALRLLPTADDAFLPPFVMLNLGDVHGKAGRFRDAERAYRSAIRLADEAHHIDHEQEGWRKLGWLAERRGRPAEAEAHYRKAIEVSTAYRESLRMTEWAAEAFVAWQPAHRGLVRVLLAQHRTRDAFLALEQTRARHLQDLQSQRALRLSLSARHRARFDSLTAALVATRNLLTTDTVSAGRRTGLRADELRLIAAKRALMAPEAFVEPLALDSLQRRLAADNQVILSYYVDAGEEPSGEGEPLMHSHVFVVTADTLLAAPLHTTDVQLRRKIGAVSPVLLASDAAPGFNATLFSLQALHELYQVLVAPVASLIPAESRLIIVPDGVLFALPFGMLVTGEAAAFAYETAPFLIRQHPVSVELAASLPGVYAAPTTRYSYDIVAFGKSDFQELPRGDAATSLVRKTAGLAALPGVRRELAAIARRFPSAALQIDADATEAAFARLSPQARILHLATHTLIGGADPRQLAIVLSADASHGRRDGLLFVHELQQSLAARLVVLSGCSTARGVFQAGEGMAGLQYAFRAMGVPATLATSWLVLDDAATTLMDAFYGYLQQGQPKELALRNAQLDFLHQAQGARASPFFWAAPVLYGATTPVALPVARRGRTLWLGLLVLLTLAAALFWRLRSRFRLFSS